VALVLAGRVRADDLAGGLRGVAVGNALRVVTDRDALGSDSGLVGFVWALYLADGLLALDVAVGVGGLFAGGVALGGLADRLADGRALGLVALPGALWVAFCGGGLAEGDGGGSGEEDCGKDDKLHFLLGTLYKL